MSLPAMRTVAEHRPERTIHLLSTPTWSKRMRPWTFPIAFVLACGVAGAQQENDTLEAIENSVRREVAKDTETTETVWLALVDRCWKLHDRSAGKPEEFETMYTVLHLTAFISKESAKGTEHWRAAMGKIVS